MERRQADLPATQPYIILPTTPITLTSTSESEGDATGRAPQNLWRPQTTGQGGQRAGPRTARQSTP